MSGKTKKSIIIKNIGRNTARDTDINYITEETDSINAVKSVNKLNIIRHIRDEIRKLEDANGNLLYSKIRFTDEMIKSINHIRPYQRVKTPAYTNDKLIPLMRFINQTLMDNYGFNYNQTRNGIYWNKKYTPYLHKTHKINHLKSMNYADHNEHKFKITKNGKTFKTNKKQSIYDNKLVNKYGTINQEIERPIRQTEYKQRLQHDERICDYPHRCY